MGNSRQQGKRKSNSNGDDLPGIWRGYGKLVKLYRERAGMTQAELAKAVGYSVEQVASIEQGRRPAKASFTEAAERVLHADGTLEALQEEVELAKLPVRFQDFRLLELDSVSHFSYEPLLIPGLLQTEDYARELFKVDCPAMDEEIIERNLEGRLDRQTLLSRTPLVELAFLVGEFAIRNLVGGPRVLKAQLEQLLELGELRNVAIQVMELSCGSHIGLTGPMVLLETAGHRQVGYLECQNQSMVISDPAKVSTLSLRYGKLRSQALSVAESARLIERVAGEL
jgi:transcriptional regulator with XRE-family HTH domain